MLHARSFVLQTDCYRFLLHHLFVYLFLREGESRNAPLRYLVVKDCCGTAVDWPNRVDSTVVAPTSGQYPKA